MNILVDGCFEIPINHDLRVHHFKLWHQLSNLACRQVVFPFRVVDSTKKLPYEFVDVASDMILKFRLNSFWVTLLASHCHLGNGLFLPNMPARLLLMRKSRFLDYLLS